MIEARIESHDCSFDGTRWSCEEKSFQSELNQVHKEYLTFHATGASPNQERAAVLHMLTEFEGHITLDSSDMEPTHPEHGKVQ